MLSGDGGGEGRTRIPHPRCDFGCGDSVRSGLRYGGPRMAQDDAAVADVHARLGIRGKRQSQALQEVLTESADCTETSPELREERGPADLDVLFHGMKAVGEPYIDVDHHRSGPNRP